MILGQAYNIYRYIHKDTAYCQSHTQFKGSVINGFLNSYIVSPVLSAADYSNHTLIQFEPGSMADGTKRRKQVACRACKNLTTDGSRNTLRRTSYFCQECKIGFHPECFTQHHSVAVSRMTPAKRLNISPGSGSGSSGRDS